MPEAATGAILVANKIFWTLGYWQVENHLIARPAATSSSSRDTATVTPPSGKRRPMRLSDLDDVLRRAHRSADGSYRAVAARGAARAASLGGFRYHGTRPDDPNDVVPHEHRRELRALKVFGAWTNLVDMKAGNTLDTLVTDERPRRRAPLPAGRRLDVRHRRQRAARIRRRLGVPATRAASTWKRLVTLGFYLRPWQTVDYVESPAIGRFEGAVFDPPSGSRACRPRRSCRARADDKFWAARRVMAFSDEMIRAIVKTGGYSDPDAARTPRRRS